MKTALVLALALMAAEEPVVRIRVTPAGVFPGQAIRLTCSVPRHADNRFLEWGVEGYRESRTQLDGEDARVTHDWIIEDMQCHVGPPFCRLIRKGARDVLVTGNVRVVGCDGAPTSLDDQ